MMRTPKSKLESGLVSLVLAPLQYKNENTGLGGLSTSIWSWGAKAAAAATELSKDVAAKVSVMGHLCQLQLAGNAVCCHRSCIVFGLQVDTGGITKGMDR